MNFDYTITTNKDFDVVIDSVQHEITTAGFKVLHIHDIQKSLEDKGFQRELFKIIEFCNAKFANEFLNTEINIGLFLPCKINVYNKNGQVYISGMRPIILKQFFPNVDLGNSPEKIDKIIQNIIDKAK